MIASHENGEYIIVIIIIVIKESVLPKNTAQCSWPGARFSKLPVITGPIKLTVLFSIPDESFKTFESYTVKFSAKETKWTSLEARTHPSFLETLISK